MLVIYETIHITHIDIIITNEYIVGNAEDSSKHSLFYNNSSRTTYSVLQNACNNKEEATPSVD